MMKKLVLIFVLLFSINAINAQRSSAKKSNSTNDGNQRIYTIIRNSNSLIPPTSDELKADNNGADVVLATNDKAKIVDKFRNVKWYTYGTNSWNSGVDEPNVDGFKTVFLGSANTYTNLPTSTSSRSSAQIDDYAFLADDDNSYKRGLYRWNGTMFSLMYEVTNKASGSFIGQSTSLATLPTSGFSGNLVKTGDWAWVNSVTEGGMYLWTGAKYEVLVPINFSTWVFLKETDVTATNNRPTTLEVENWAKNKTPKVFNQFIYYNGTDTPTIKETHTYYVDYLGSVRTMKDLPEVQQNNNTSNSITQNQAVAPSNVSTVLDWLPTTYYSIGSIVKFYIGGSLAYMTNNTAVTTNATIDINELDKWNFITQSLIPEFDSTSIYPWGFKVRYLGSLWETVNTTIAGNFKPSDWFKLSTTTAITQLNVNWNTTISPELIASEGTYLIIAGNGVQTSAGQAIGLGSQIGNNVNIDGRLVTDVSNAGNCQVWNTPYFLLTKSEGEITVVSISGSSNVTIFSRGRNTFQAFLNAGSFDPVRGRSNAWEVWNRFNSLQWHQQTASTLQTLLDNWNSANSGSGTLTTFQYSDGGAFATAILTNPLPQGHYTAYRSATNTLFIQKL
jgi:hypothetical protein